MREAGEVQAGGKCAEREEDGAHERFLPQAEDQEEMMHYPFNVSRRRGWLSREADEADDRLGEPALSPSKLNLREWISGLSVWVESLGSAKEEVVI